MAQIDRQNHRIFADAGVAVSVKVGIGAENERRWREFPVDQETGKINISPVYLYDTEEHNEIGGPQVRAFELELSHRKDDDLLVVVSGRDAVNQYKRQLPGFGYGELQTYHFPPCTVAVQNRNGKLRQAERNCGPTSVFTTPKSQSDKRGINRVDPWVFRKDGLIGLFQVSVNSFTDGKDFTLFGEWRGRWQIHRLANPRPHKPQYSPMSKRAAEQKIVFDDQRVNALLEKVILVPEGSYTGFDSRIEILENAEVRNWIEDNLHRFPVWDEKTEDGEPIRNFSIRPDVAGVKLSGNRGSLQWFSHSMAACGMGIVTGADGVERQVRYHSFTSAVKDVQGLLQILDGDVVEWEEEIDMGDKYPKLLGGARVQLVNVAHRRAMPIVDSAPAAAAA